MHFNLLRYLILSVCFSSLQVFAEEQRGSEHENETNYNESVNFFSSIFGFFQDTRKGAYNLMFETRDGIDGFAYDVKEDYINKSKTDISE
jgi:hypothetical protein